MTQSDKTTSGGRGRRVGPVVASVALLGALLIPMLASSSASAATAAANKTTTTCVNYPAGNCITTTTKHQGPTTTRPHGIIISLTISYSHGIVTWQACIGIDAAGTTVQLYLDGVLISRAGGSAVVLANGCTSDPSFPICLVTGTYLAVAVDPSFGAPKASMAVNNSGCANPITLGSATIGNSSGPGSSSSPSSSSGGLAFTGANIALLLLAAALLIVVGYAIVRLNRQRRRTT